MPLSLEVGRDWPGGSLTRNLSVFLDLLRLVAALLVLVAHAGEIYRMGLPAMLGHSAKEAVAVFFVLSGFVIGFVTHCKERDWKAFAKARALRLYSVVPLSVALIIGCYQIGSAANPAVYDAAVGGQPSLLAILRYLTFTNEIWFDRAIVGTAAPFWSLGFEVAYYVWFAVLIYGRGRWRWGLMGLWLLVFGPRIALALALWLIGAAAWTVVSRGFRVGPIRGGLVLAAIAFVAFGWRRWCAFVAMPLFEWGPLPALAMSMGYYLALCILVAAAIAVFAACTGERSIWPPVLEKVIRFCAGASFTIYIAHLPVMVLILAIWPGAAGSFTGGAVATCITVIAMLILAEFGERRKGIYKSFASSLVKNVELIFSKFKIAID
ncbi:acyltransferase [Novosphingobium resinovorum]|uniref:acyltransferase family protein n=1 Tax=Novosphingobium resinovorum TaxID=158500 RepID=UPI002ED206D3|nr:acyltransferase [Novosphingobium resinovorum]